MKTTLCKPLLACALLMLGAIACNKNEDALNPAQWLTESTPTVILRGGGA